MERKVILLLCLILLAIPLTSCAVKPMEPTATSTPSPVSITPTPPPATTSPVISTPQSTDTRLSPEEIERLKSYWEYDGDWAITTPSRKGFHGTWSVGLGDAYESTLALPYDGLDFICEPAQDLAALSFGSMERRYFDGFSTIKFRDFYGDQPNEPEYSVTYYISTTQPDCETPRGIHPGNTVAELEEAYPEVQKHEGYWTDNNLDYGNASHDSCYFYAPEGTNRSILFLIKDDTIVQIDMVDGLDGQILCPSGPGVHHAK